MNQSIHLIVLHKVDHPLTVHTPSWYTFLNNFTKQRIFLCNQLSTAMTTIQRRDNVNCALIDYQNGQYPSLPKAAAAWDVSVMTLSQRHQGQQSWLICNQNQQKLSVKEKKALIDYVQCQTKAGYLLSVEALRQMANILLSQHCPSILSQ